MSDDTTQVDNYEYDEDFDDDGSADENNSIHHDGAMFGDRTRGERSNSLDTTDFDFSKPTGGNASVLSKTNKRNVARPGKNFDPYKTTNPASRRAQSDPHGRKSLHRPIANNTKGSSARSTVSNKSSNDLMMNRVLSANRKKTASLHNALTELQQQCEELRIENKDLKRSIRIQDRDLRKYDGEEADLPMIMKRHNNEIKVLQEKYKKQKEMSTNLSENLRRADTELLKTRDKLKEFENMAKEKNLGERLELKNKVLDLQYAMEEKEGKISELNRALLLQKKTQNRIVKEKNEKYTKAMQRIKTLEEENANLIKSKLNENPNSVLRVNDEKQMVLSPQNPISPLLRKLEEENSKPTSKLLLLTEKENNADESPVKPLINGGRIDTMVNRTEHNESVDQSDVDETFLTQGKIPDTQEECVENESYLRANTFEENEHVSFPVAKGTPRASVKIDETEKVLNDKLDTPNACQPLEETPPSPPLPPPSPPLSIQTPKEPDDAVKARNILLAKLQAIDQGENPNDVTENTYNVTNKNDEKKKKDKKPIFLISAHDAETPKESPKSIGEIGDSTWDSAGDSNTDSKPNSGNSRSRRVETMLDKKQEKGDEKYLQRRDSLESRKTDESLFQGGLSSHTNFSPQTTGRSNSGHDKNSVNDFDGDINSFFSGDHKDSIFAGKNEDSIFRGDYKPPRPEQSYSPSLNSNSGVDKKTTKGGFSLFDQFEDPFKSSSKSSKQGSVLNNRKSEQPELFSKTSESVDDLEEMFIL